MGIKSWVNTKTNLVKTIVIINKPVTEVLFERVTIRLPWIRLLFHA